MIELTRREALGAASVAGVAILIGGVRPFGLDGDEAAAATCVMTPDKTVGPYFVEEKLNRSDVRTDSKTGVAQAGVPLTLSLYVFDADQDCAPVQGATVDIWHCNANGLYSDESANRTGGVDWLRGYQTTDAAGKVTFTTVYPGWYTGRAVHIHFKVRVYSGTTETLEFTSQMFFTDEMNATVFQTEPYKTHGTTPDVKDSSDSIYGNDTVLLLHPESDGKGGYVADFSVGVSTSTSQLDNTSAGAGGGGPTGGGGPQPPTATATPTTTTPDETVGAVLKDVRFHRTTSGRREVRYTLVTTEPLAVQAVLTRDGSKLASKTTRFLAAGTHTIKLGVPSKVAAGGARLSVTLTDALSNHVTKRHVVHVRRRKR